MQNALIAALAGAIMPTVVWDIQPAMPRPSAGHAAAVLDGRLWIVGGTNWRDETKYWLDDIAAFDIAASGWAPAGNLPLAVAYAASASDGETLYVCGGSDGESPLRSCMALSPGASRLRVRAIPPLPEPRVYAGAAVCEATLYIVAGAASHADLTTVSGSLFALDLAGSGAAWRALAPLPNPRFIPGVASAGGKVLAFGGGTLDAEGHAVNLADCWSYDPAEDAWSPLPDLPAASRGTSAVAVNDDRLLLLGGYTATWEEAQREGPSYGFSDQVLAFRPSDGALERVGRIPVPAVGTSPVFADGSVYITGGEERMRSRIDVFAVAEIAP